MTPGVGPLHGKMGPALAEYLERRRPLLEDALRVFSPGTAPAWLAAGAGLKKGALPPAFSEPVDLYLSRRGKMLRSLLACVVLDALGKAPASFKPLIGMMEVLESDTIMIDDIIDASPERRGGPSAHIVCGVNRTILAGGFFYYAGWHLLHKAFGGPGGKKYLEALAWFTRIHLLTSVGQTEEICYLVRGRPLTLARYCQEISSRICVLSFSGPLYLPALCAGASPEKLKALERLGLYMGLAYHLHGDELNLYPRSANWGKSRADDLLSGTITYLYSMAVKRLNPAGRKKLAAVFGRRGASPARVEEVLALISGCGALADNRRAINGLAGKAEKIISSLRFPVPQARLLRECLAYMAAGRAN